MQVIFQAQSYKYNHHSNKHNSELDSFRPQWSRNIKQYQLCTVKSNYNLTIT